MIEISTAPTVGTVGTKGYRPTRDVTMTMVEDCLDYFGSDLVTIRATRVVSQEMYDDREGRAVIELLVNNSLIGACGAYGWRDGTSPILDWLELGDGKVRRPAASWKQLGDHQVLADGSLVAPDWIYACSYEVSRSVLQGATRTVT